LKKEIDRKKLLELKAEDFEELSGDSIL